MKPYPHNRWNRSHLWGSVADTPVFQTSFAKTPPSASNLSRDLSDELSSAVTPLEFHVADGASAMTNEYGTAMYVTGTGTAPSSTERHALYGDNDEATILAGQYLTNGVNHSLAAGDDLLFEAIINNGNASGYNFACGFLGGPGSALAFYQAGASNYLAFTSSAMGINALTTSATIGQMHWLGAIQASTGNVYLAINGVVVGTDSLYTAAGYTLAQFMAGFSGDGYSFSQLGLWINDGMFDGVIFSDFAAERYSRLTGTYNSIMGAPTVTRSTSKKIGKVTSTGKAWVDVAANWPSIEHTPYGVAGFRPEVPATNHVLQSNELTTSPWVNHASATLTKYNIGPCGQGWGCAFAPGVYTDSYAARQPITTLTAGNVYRVSSHWRESTARYVTISTYDGTTWSHSYYDSVTNTFSVISPNHTNLSAEFGGQLNVFRISCTVTATATFEIATFISDSSAGISLTADGSTNVYVCSFQVEDEIGGATSLVETSTTAVQRAGESFYYTSPTSLPEEISVSFDAMFIAVPSGPATAYYFEVNDGGAGTDRLYSYTFSAGVARFGGYDGGVSQFNVVTTTDMYDMGTHTVELLAKTNNSSAKIDGSYEGTPDTVCTIPTTLDRIYIGGRPGVANCPTFCFFHGLTIMEL